MSSKVVITGAAGLVGQNLIARLKERETGCIVAIDKHPSNVRILRSLHPQLRVIEADLAQHGIWEDEFEGITHLVNAHAQIGGLHKEEYVRNNVTATENVLNAAVKNNVQYIVNISSSVVNSMTVDNYTETKKAQESLVASTGVKQVVLRPTLMFGWFDRKHTGWLARFMSRVPVFPIPGDGRYLRQPLYAGDFCNIILSALESGITGAFNISGQEKIDYIDLMQGIKKATYARARILKLPYGVFWGLLKVNSLLDNNPAFTTKQLEALVTPDVFEVINWPQIFQVRSTPLQEALELTFRHPEYSRVVLDF